MVRTTEKVESLLEEDEEYADAIAAVHRAADEDGGEIEWADVEGEVTSGQWGRLIEQGILRSGEDGFRLADPEGVAALVDDDGRVSLDDEGSTEVDADSSWTQWDKLAGLATLAVMAGYYFDPVQDLVGGTVDALFAPLTAVLPFYAVVLIAALVTGLYSTLLQSLLRDDEAMAAYQERMREIQERRKAAKERGDDEALERIQEEQIEAMGDQLGMFKEMFRPMVWIMLFTIPVFLWLYWTTGSGRVADETVVMPFLGAVDWTDGLFGWFQAWLLWYLLCSMAFNQLLRKALNVEMSPGS